MFIAQNHDFTRRKTELNSKEWSWGYACTMYCRIYTNGPLYILEYLSRRNVGGKKSLAKFCWLHPEHTLAETDLII